ncbi:MAG: helix-turn-helix transcriptional regulator [Bacteroidales bacterium]|nr:helix-turn-helix transcriptional regulator [Bacteroidales bacterium]
MHNAALASKDIRQTHTCSVNILVNQALTFIDNNITKPISIDTICNSLYITKSHLHRLFIKHLNISPKQYILSQKLLLAKNEIFLGNKPTDVYLTYGLSNYSTFYRDYKKYFEHSQSEEYYLNI